MFEARRNRTIVGEAGNILALIYHNTVRSVRRSHGNALIGLLLNILQTVIMIVAFWAMMTIMGMTGIGLRGNFVLYLMSGIFIFMTHSKAMGAVMGAEGPTSPMMQHAPMNTAISICAAALSSLYTQVLSMVVVLYVYHAAFTPITIEEPVAAFGMLLLAWFYGIAVGMIFLAVRPWMPEAVGIASTVYSRVNMIASGKMFTANTLSFGMLAVFDWNPLFHLIDQARGFVFLNYEPRYTSISYAVYVSLALVMIGLMAEFFTRRHVSLSWSARR
jgi:ABC-type polysaccharide/polyol phosphate export permease